MKNPKYCIVNPISLIDWVEKKPYTSRDVRTVWEGARIKPPMKVGMAYMSPLH